MYNSRVMLRRCHMAHQQITAIIYDKRGKVLSIGQNSYIKTHPRQAKWAAACGEPLKQFLHAEIHAITRCRNLAKAHKIVVIRYNKNGEPALAAPCPICSSAIKAAGIKHVEHT